MVFVFFSKQLLASAVADAQSVLHELEANLSSQGEEVAAFAEQQREVSAVLVACMLLLRR